MKAPKEKKAPAGAARHAGTTWDMVVGELKEPLVVESPLAGSPWRLDIAAMDDDGFYATSREYVGAGLLDPWRDPARRRVDIDPAVCEEDLPEETYEAFRVAYPALAAEAMAAEVVHDGAAV